MKNAVIISAFDNYGYNVRTKYVEKYFEDKGYNVKLISSDFDHRNKKTYNVQRKNLQLVHVKEYKKNLSVDRIVSHKEFAQRAFKAAEQYEPSIIYVGTPPNFSFKYAAKYKKKHSNAKLIFEIGDMWPETLPVNKNIKAIIFPFLKIWKYLRDKYIKCADGIVFECDLFRNYLCDYTKGIPGITLYLTKDFDNNPINRTIPSVKNGINICYVGSLNNIFDSKLTSELINELAMKCKVTFHIIGDGEKKIDFLNMLKNVNIIDHGIVYDEEEKSNIYAECHLALNLMKTNVFVGLTMKSIEYFAAGLPIINNIPEDTENIIKQNECGYNLNNNIDKTVKWIMRLNDEMIANMKINSYKVYRENFTVDVFNNRFSELIEKC